MSVKLKDLLEKQKDINKCEATREELFIELENFFENTEFTIENINNDTSFIYDNEIHISIEIKPFYAKCYYEVLSDDDFNNIYTDSSCYYFAEYSIYPKPGQLIMESIVRDVEYTLKQTKFI